jgi:hypothetical protein
MFTDKLRYLLGIVGVFILSSTLCLAAVNQNGQQDGLNILSAAVALNGGQYSFRNVNTGRYLSLLATGNIVSPNQQGASNDTAALWTVIPQNFKYFSIHIANAAGNVKCVSTRWSFTGPQGGFNDAAVMWQCEDFTSKRPRSLSKKRAIQNSAMKRGIAEASADTNIPGANGKDQHYGNYGPIRHDKQLWVAVPVPGSNSQYKIVSAAHLISAFGVAPMIPVCLAGSPIDGGTKLTNCFVDTTDANLYWELTMQ